MKGLILASVLVCLMFPRLLAHNPPNNKIMKIEIWSDVSCPFCYIGKRHLESALKAYEHREQVQIEWKSYLLDPTLPDETDQNVMEMLSEKKGLSMQQVKQMTYHVEAMGKEAGLNYDFSKPVPVSTYKAHLLIQLAKQKGLEEASEERLFKAYFMEGKNVADTAVLKDLGKEIGLSSDDLAELFTDSSLQSKLEADLYEAKTIGVSGVPFFLINDQYAISGAQPVELFLKTFEKVALTEVKVKINASEGLVDW